MFEGVPLNGTSSSAVVTPNMSVLKDYYSPVIDGGTGGNFQIDALPSLKNK